MGGRKLQLQMQAMQERHDGRGRNEVRKIIFECKHGVSKSSLLLGHIKQCAKRKRQEGRNTLVLKP